MASRRVPAVCGELRSSTLASRLRRRAAVISCPFPIRPCGRSERGVPPIPRRSRTARASIDAGRGGRSTPSSSRRWNGLIGSTIAGCCSPSATTRRPRPRSTTTPRWINQLWRRDSNETASGKPGAVRPLDAPDGAMELLPSSLDRTKPATVLISHPHQDHWGLVDELPQEWPIWTGEGSAKLIAITGDITRRPR
jgi:hypothetical protein